MHAPTLASSARVQAHGGCARPAAALPWLPRAHGAAAGGGARAAARTSFMPATLASSCSILAAMACMLPNLAMNSSIIAGVTWLGGSAVGRITPPLAWSLSMPLPPESPAVSARARGVSMPPCRPRVVRRTGRAARLRRVCLARRLCAHRRCRPCRSKHPAEGCSPDRPAARRAERGARRPT